MIRRILRGTGEILITLGLVILLFAAYQVYGNTFKVNAEQKQLNGALGQQWNARDHVPRLTPSPQPTVDKPVPGQPMGRLYVPRLGKQWVIIEGVAPVNIKLSPGHYPKSQLPGQVGNFAVAGHRVPAIFWDLDLLKAGDALVVETRLSWHLYAVRRVFIVKPTDIFVVAANPSNPAAMPTAKHITLTTCNPKWDNYQRLIVQGELVREQPKTMGRPAELGRG